ncbi:MAG TPA: AAA family ATPase [Planctomycetaceae bacterium]|nr:AAA family ATPase [Planctomycetaceae bacterium]
MSKKNLERELAEERKAVEEDFHRYDDIDPGLNDAFLKQFPEARGTFGMPHSPMVRQRGYPGAPVPADFDLPDDMEIEKRYQPPAQPLSRSRHEVDLYPIVERYSKVWNVEQEWLWPQRIPRGTLTLLAGDPSVGKSRLAIDLAARISAGIPWPDDPAPKPGPRANVVLLTAEDSPEREVRKRLIAAGADLDRVLNFRCVGEMSRTSPHKATRGFRIPDDVPGLDNVLHEWEPVKLVVIDTLADFWGGGGMRHNAEVRACLAPLMEMAANRNVAVVCLTHLNKRFGLSGLYRTMDSLAFMAVSRAVWGVARDPRDPERRLWLPVKMNLNVPPAGLSFRIVENKVQWETEQPEESWEETVTAIHPRKSDREIKRELAELWLRDLLSRGEVPAREIQERAKALTFGGKLLVGAKKRLGVRKIRRGFGEKGATFWALPQ